MSIVLIWCASFAIYLLFAGQVSLHEVATGVVLASFVTAWARIIRAASQRHFSFLPGFLWPLGCGLGQLFPAAFATGRVLARVAFLGGRAGHAETHDFLPGASDDGPGHSLGQSVDRARRACAVLLASCAPDRFVVNIDRDSSAVLIHAIVPGERELDPQWLI
jgi:hypothetical protein